MEKNILQYLQNSKYQDRTTQKIIQKFQNVENIELLLLNMNQRGLIVKTSDSFRKNIYWSCSKIH